MKHLNSVLSMTCTLLLTLCVGCNSKPSPAVEESSISADNIYQFSILDADSNRLSLDAFRGKVVLVVNTATQCGFTPQYEELQNLYSRFHSRGFEILDFPCNQFGSQAPGSNGEIHSFCSNTFGTEFPQMSKIEVNGPNADSLFVYLKEKAPFHGFDTTDPRGAYLDKMFRSQDSLYDANPDIKWNFTKFLINRDGKVVRRFEPTDSMSDLSSAVEELL